MLKIELGPADCVRTGRPIGEIDRTRGNLRRETEQVLSRGSVGLNAPVEFAGERMSDLVDIRAYRASQRLAMTRIVVDAANDPSNDAVTLPAMQRGIDGRTSSQIGKIRLGEGPPPPVAVDPAKYLLFNELLHSEASIPARKNTTFFLQDVNVPEEGGGGLPIFAFRIASIRFNPKWVARNLALSLIAAISTTSCAVSYHFRVLGGLAASNRVCA